MKCWSIVILSAACLVTTCLGHTVHWGRTCPELKAFPNLSVNKILGEWFVAYQFDTSNTCLLWDIKRPVRELDELEIVETRQLHLLDAVGIDHKQSVTGNVDFSSTKNPSEMRIRWYSSMTGKADFTVFDTDYDNYLAIYQCDRAGLFHRRDVTVLSKTKEINPMFIERIRRLLDTAEIPHTSLEEISHHMCRDQTLRNWHIDSELFGLLPKSEAQELVEKFEQTVDISEIEIIGDGV